MVAVLALNEGTETTDFLQLDRTLCEIAERFGAARREWVMMELEDAGTTACAL